jgi:pyrroloquinoline quinone biosynthesis protein D
MSDEATVRRPVLASHARYRWDPHRRQHQIVFPEGLLVLNESAAAAIRLCDGRPLIELLAALDVQFSGFDAGELRDFLDQLVKKGLLRDASVPA